MVREVQNAEAEKMEELNREVIKLKGEKKELQENT